MLRFLYHIGRAVAHQGLGQIGKAILDPTLVTAGDLLGRIAAEAMRGLRDESRQERLHADILEAAKMSFSEAARQAHEVGRLVSPDDAELREHVERFVTLVPAAVNASLRRAEDPSGRSLPALFALEDESDLVKLLPVRFPRPNFRPGFAPPFLRGWELVEQIGAGGFGEVWKARNPEASHLVGAVKFGHALSDAELSLLNESDVLNLLLAGGRHPGIVELQDCSLRRANDPEHVPWLRYEYVPGGDLTGLVRVWAGLTAGERLTAALGAFRELCDTVGHFHRLTPSPIVHRDLKPSNILVAADGRLKVGDFGIGSVSSRRVLDGERQGSLSRINTVQAYLRGAHTPLYAPPEQRTDPKHRPRPTDDVHALGVILFQMLTGKLDAAPGARFDRHLKGVPQAVIDLIGDCVDPAPENRPADAAELARRIPTTPRVAASAPPSAQAEPLIDLTDAVLEPPAPSARPPAPPPATPVVAKRVPEPPAEGFTITMNPVPADQVRTPDLPPIPDAILALEGQLSALGRVIREIESGSHPRLKESWKAVERLETVDGEPALDVLVRKLARSPNLRTAALLALVPNADPKPVLTVIAALKKLAELKEERERASRELKARQKEDFRALLEPLFAKADRYFPLQRWLEIQPQVALRRYTFVASEAELLNAAERRFAQRTTGGKATTAVADFAEVSGSWLTRAFHAVGEFFRGLFGKKK